MKLHEFRILNCLRSFISCRLPSLKLSLSSMAMVEIGHLHESINIFYLL